MLPDIDGFEVVRRLRAGDNEVPVIFLTARDTTSDTVTGLALGGDDYITKPFSVEALVARVRAVLRRARRQAGAGGRAGDAGRVHPAGRRPGTRRGPLDRAARGHPDRAVADRVPAAGLPDAQPGPDADAQARLLGNVWGWEHGGQSLVLETYVSYLQRKLDPLGPPLIHTQRGVGYSLRPS